MYEPLSAEGLLDLVTADASVTIMLLDRDLRIRYISHTAPGLTVDEVLGTSVLDHISEDQHAARRACHERVAATRKPERYETTYHSKEGVVSRWDSRVGPVVRDGEVTGFVILASDITERHEAAMQRDRLFELSLDLLCVADANGRFLRVNPAFAKTLGYSEPELTGRPFSDFVHPDDIERTNEAFADLLEQQQTLKGFENRYLRKDGPVRTLEWSATIDPVTSHAFAVARDVTEARAVQAQLRQAQKMDAVGQLAGGIAHDFNNLLQAIIGNVHFARAEATTEGRVEFLAQIEAAAERATELTKKLLSFSRRQPVAFSALDMNAVARELIELLRRVIPEDIEVDLVAGHALDTIAGDRTQVEQVLMNLCLNARDAMPDGGRITIETENLLIDGSFRENHPWARTGRYVLLTVSDTGEGIPPEIRERIFEPFFTTKEGKSVGLGLSTVYGIVQQHGGSIQVYSEPGRGTTFKVYLPVTARLASRVGPKLDAKPRGEGELILVAEDEPLVREVVVRILENGGYRVLVASNGREAVKLCEEHDAIGLALLDVVMPELDGVAAAARLRELRPDLPLLFSSGHSDPVRFEAKLPEGARVLNKPYHAAALLNRVRQTLDAAKPQDAPRRESAPDEETTAEPS